MLTRNEWWARDGYGKSSEHCVPAFLDHLAHFHRKNLLTTELSRAKAELTDRLSFELESSLRSATLASNEALRDAFQIIKDYSTELRELRGELRDLER